MTNALLMNALKRSGEVFTADVQKLIGNCRTREQCMDVSNWLSEFAVRVQGLIDDGCYQRAFELDRERE